MHSYLFNKHTHTNTEDVRESRESREWRERESEVAKERGLASRIEVGDEIVP